MTEREPPQDRWAVHVLFANDASMTLGGLNAREALAEVRDYLVNPLQKDRPPICSLEIVRRP